MTTMRRSRKERKRSSNEGSVINEKTNAAAIISEVKEKM